MLPCFFSISRNCGIVALRLRSFPSAVLDTAYHRLCYPRERLLSQSSRDETFQRFHPHRLRRRGMIQSKPIRNFPPQLKIGVLTKGIKEAGAIR